MKANAPIFYILSQIGVFCIVYTLLLATHTNSFAIDVCDPDFRTKTLINILKVFVFVLLIHAPGVIVSHRFSELTWTVAVLPLLCAMGFVVVHYVNDLALLKSGALSCETDFAKPDMRSIFRPDWNSEVLSLASRAAAYSWGVASLVVLYLISRIPTMVHDE